MTIHSANNNVDLLRVTVLSLEGIRISALSASCCVGSGSGSGSDGVVDRSGNQNDHQKNSDSVNNIIGNNDLAASSVSSSSSSSPYYQHPTTLIISAHAGFRTTFPPESVSVSCPQYSTLFPLHEGNLLTVKSKEETVTISDYRNDARDKNKSLVEIVLHWGIDDDDDDEEEEVHDADNSNNNDASSNNEETNNEQVSPIITIVVPHLEIMLPSSSSSSTTTISNNLSPSSKDEDECDTGAVSEIPPSPPTPTIAALPEVIEFHVCVTITPATPDDRHAISGVNGNHDCGLDENDTLDKDSFALDEENTQQDHWLPPPPTPSSSSTATIHHYGIAHLKLPPTELYHANDDEFSTSSLSYGRPGGKVVILPIRKKYDAFTHRSAAHHDDEESGSTQQQQRQQQQHQQQRSTKTVQFTSNAALFVRVERIRVPNIHHFKKMEQQCHYIESTWEHGHGFAPASIIHHDDENDEGKDTKESVEKENKDRGTIWFTMKRSLFASTTSKESPTTRKDKDVILSEHSQMREEIAPTLYQAMAMTMEKREQYASHRINRINRRRSTGAASASAAAAAAAATDANRQTQSATSTNDERYSYPLRKSLSLQNIREKILCGASLPSMSETLKLVIEAGQHCDEDHGGLYVVNSNSFGGSTIGTAD